MKFEPECLYKPECLSKEDLTKRFNTNQLVSFVALDWDAEKKVIVTTFDNDTLAYIPADEVCNENFKFINGFTCPVQIHSIIGKTACALITNINGNELILSRKKLQEKALKELVPGNIYNVCVKNITDIGVFVDIAVGITAFVHNSEITKTQFNSKNDAKATFNLFKGKIIPAKLLEAGENIKMSFRQAFNFPLIAKGDTVYGIVRNKLIDGTGYFVDISPNDTAIVDTNKQLCYGDKIIVEIKYSECVFENNSFYNKHHTKLVI